MAKAKITIATAIRTACWETTIEENRTRANWRVSPDPIGVRSVHPRVSISHLPRASALHRADSHLWGALSPNALFRGRPIRSRPVLEAGRTAGPWSAASALTGGIL